MTRFIQKLARELSALFHRRHRYRPEKHYMRGRPTNATQSDPVNSGLEAL